MIILISYLNFFPGYLHNMPGSSNAKPSKRAKANTNATLKNIPIPTIPSELFNMVLNHASPQSRRRLSQVNKSLQSMAESRVGGEIVYYKPGPVWGLEFYKLGKNGKLKPLQPHGEQFEYYKKGRFPGQGQFVMPMYKHTAVNNLRLVREKTKNRHGAEAYRVKPKSPTPERKTIATNSKSPTPEQRATRAKLMEHEQRASNASKAIMSKKIINNKKFYSNPNHPIAEFPAYRNIVLKLSNIEQY